MKKILSAALTAAVGVIGLAACDAAPRRDAAVSRPVEPEVTAVSRPAESEAIAAREAFADVLRDPDAYSRARRLGALLPTLGPEAVPAVKETLENPTLDVGGTEIELLVRFWATHQPEDASGWAEAKSPPDYRVSAIYSSLPLWAEADPRAAAKAVQQWKVFRADWRNALQVALVRGWFAANPPELERYIHDMGMGFSRQRALIQFIRSAIQERGADAVMRWAESLPDDDPLSNYKKTVYSHVAAALAVFEPEAAVRWCEAQCDSRHGDGLRGVIAKRWVRSDGPAALAWLSSAPEGHERDLAVRVTFAVWGQLDREAALGWVATQTQTSGKLDPWLRPILPVYARFLALDSPLEAIEWAGRIEDDEARKFALIAVAQLWRRADAAAAEAWLRQSSLSEEDRQKARAVPGPPGQPARPSG